MGYAAPVKRARNSSLPDPVDAALEALGGAVIVLGPDLDICLLYTSRCV